MLALVTRRRLAMGGRRERMESGGADATIALHCAAGRNREQGTGGTIAPSDPDVRWAAFVLGLAAIVGGSALREWAVLTLGTTFTFDVRVASDQHVVTNGPYRFLRHPSYPG